MSWLKGLDRRVRSLIIVSYIPYMFVNVVSNGSRNSVERTKKHEAKRLLLGDHFLLDLFLQGLLMPPAPSPDPLQVM